jgi:hypothetical protein
MANKMNNRRKVGILVGRIIKMAPKIPHTNPQDRIVKMRYHTHDYFTSPGKGIL